MLCVPFCLLWHVGFVVLFCLQSLILVFNMGDGPAQYIFLKQLPVYKRFTTSSFTYALGRALTYIVTSFGIVYLTEYFNHWGLLIITMPIGVLFLMSITYFDGLQSSKEVREESKLTPSDSNVYLASS
jgi:MHS family proline/betaine transporter-like MFS transporter